MMNNDTEIDDSEDEEMDYSEWISCGEGVGAFLVDHARTALDAMIASEQDDERGASQEIDTCLGRFQEIHRQCSRWRALAVMENMFRVYPDVVTSVGARIEMPMDGCGEFLLKVNKDYYDPGDGNEFCGDTMDLMEEIDGLEAINLAHDTLACLCAREHPIEETDQMVALGSEKTQAQLQALMAMEAPELNASVLRLWMEQGTEPAKEAPRAGPRM